MVCYLRRLRLPLAFGLQLVRRFVELFNGNYKWSDEEDEANDLESVFVRPVHVTVCREPGRDDRDGVDCGVVLLSVAPIVVADCFGLVSSLLLVRYVW